MKRKPQLYLFVWQGFCPDYSDGLAVAIAETEQAAKALVEQERGGLKVYQWGTLTIDSLDAVQPFAVCVSGGS